MGNIAVLPAAVAARIAAGEIIERPASVVRELIENSLDAGARNVDVRVRDGGLSSISVVDDGCGMDEKDAQLCFERYATSKLRTAADLTSIATHGYRGEALAAIALCADVELATTPRGANKGTYVRLDGGRRVEVRAVARAAGTSVTVYRLFDRMPARRTLLDDERKEAIQCQRVVTAYALARPDVRFRFFRDDKLVLHTAGQGELRDVVASLFPSTVSEHLLELDDTVALSSGSACLYGLVGSPGFLKRSRAFLFVAVNGRPLQQRSLLEAVEKAYLPFATGGWHPVAFLRLDVPAGEVDVNIHPAKAQVRFRSDAVIRGLIHGAIGRVLCGDLAEDDLWQRDRERPLSAADLSSLQHASYLGQWANAYLVFADATALYLVDQHAAAERVAYECILRSEAFALDRPLIVTLAPAERSVLDIAADSIAALGFEFDLLDKSSLMLRAVPEVWRHVPVQDAFLELLHALASDETGDLAYLAAVQACHRSARRGEPFDEARARELVEDLMAIDASTCPHGRPAFLRLELHLADKLFLRRGF